MSYSDPNASIIEINEYNNVFYHFMELSRSQSSHLRFSQARHR
jgi:hypothetical protein